MRINLKLSLSLLGVICCTGIVKSQLTTSENYVSSKTHVDTSGNNVLQSVTYFDGLGRPKQIVNVKASNNSKDLVTPIVYDEFGRQRLDVLPIPLQTNPQAFYGNLDEANATTYYQSIGLGGSAYSEKILEASPLDRVLEQYGPGDSWRSNAKRIKYDYKTNVGNEVRLFKATADLNVYTNTLIFSGYYNANTLYKNIVTDEDGGITIEFKNGEGQTLLVRKTLGNVDGVQATIVPDQGEYVDTYYVYNQYNQLAFVIPPLAVKSGDFSQNILDNLCYQYVYDAKNRLVIKKLPGKAEEYMVYDKADRLILTQDGDLRLKGKWLFSKYDKLGRVIYTGIHHSGGTRKVMQDAILNKVITEERDATGFSKNGLHVYYKNFYYFDFETLLSVNYYDTYPTGTPYPTANKIFEQPILTNPNTNNNPNPTDRSTNSLPVASFVKNVENDAWTKTYSFYDDKSRPIGTTSINYLGGTTSVYSLLNFSGLPIQTKTTHKKTAVQGDINILEEFVYDPQNRLSKHYHTVEGKTPRELLTFNEYDDLGRLKSKKVGGADVNNYVERTTYNYNIRGWMTGINLNESNLNLDASKLFSYKIKYQDPQGNTVKKYNGNISEIDWSFNTTDANRYQYYYDSLNRLTRADYKSLSNLTTSLDTKFFNESLSYDVNGNIKTLARYAKPQFGSTAILIDNLTYTYDNNNFSNRLLTIKDTSGKANGYPSVVNPNTIIYDNITSGNGNMTAMMDKGISNITYNHLNLPISVTQRGYTTLYTYRADGTKVYKKASIGPTTLETDYIDGFVYTTPYTEQIEMELRSSDIAIQEMATAGQREAFDLVAKPIDPINPPIKTQSSPDFFPTSEGFYDFQNSKYIYQYKDHLGNVRLSYSRNSSTGAIEKEDTNNYYPFGLSFVDLSSNQFSFYSPSTSYKNYKYNGKELQETGMYDYGARFYMPDIGRWGVVDPAAEYFPDITPYAYVVNDPIGFIDNDGEMPGPVGAIIGVFSDYITQVGVNYFLEGKSFNTSLTDVSYWSLAISGASGFATGGISALTKAATSGIGKQALVKTIDFGVDVLVGTVENAVTDYAEKGEFDVWKSITGGLLEAGIGKFIPLKYVDKLESKLAKKMNISAEKMTRYKNRMQNDANRSRSTRARNNRKYAENKKAYESYTKAYAGVKIVNDAYKAGGAEALQNIDLFKKTPETTKKPTITVGEVTGEIIRE